MQTESVKVKPVSVREIAPAVLKVFGLEGMRVRNLSLHLGVACDPVVLKVERYVTEQEMLGVMTVVEDYTLVRGVHDDGMDAEAATFVPDETSGEEADGA